jgi:hypothetical protein
MDHRDRIVIDPQIRFGKPTASSGVFPLPEPGLKLLFDENLASRCAQIHWPSESA